jgi:hypothetical protein
MKRKWLWCKHVSLAGDDEGMQRFVPIEDVFKGRHFDRQIIVLCVSWYTSFKLSLRDLVIMARPVGGSWKRDETYIKVHGQWVYLYRAVDKTGQTVFLSQLEPLRERGQVVSAESNEDHSRANEDHLGRLCGLAPGGARDEGRRRTSVSPQGSIQSVLEQTRGAGPSESEATNPADAGIQAIRQCGRNDLRNRVSRENQEGAVQDGQARRVRCDDDRTVERRTRSLSPIRNHLQGGA